MLEDLDLKEIQKRKYIGGWIDHSDIFLWYREQGQRKVVRIPNVPKYFCIDRVQFEKADRALFKNYKQRELYTKGVITGRYAYVYPNMDLYKSNMNSWLTEMDNAGLKPLEADLSNLQRYMIDNNIQVASPADENGPTVVYFDIETDDRQDMIEIGGERIVSMAWKDAHTGKEYFERLQADTDEAEKDFLTRIYTAIVQYDVRVGYNNYGFDDPYLQLRFERYHIDLDKWKRVASLDIFNIFERQGTYRKYDVRNRKLDTIGKAVLGRGKIEHTEKIWELWTNHPDKLEEYNLEDVRLIYDMENILGSVNLVLSVCSFAGLLHSLNYSPAKTVDTFLLRSAQKRRKDFDFRYGTSYYRPEHMSTGKFGAFSRNALPSDKRKGRKEILLDEFNIEYEPVLGALVMEADPGLYRNVYAFDFQSLYPNTIRAFNIGHDTLVDETFTGTKNQAPNGQYYRTDIISGMSEGVTFLINKRREVRAGMKLERDEIRLKALDILQRGIKELTNSFYGVTAQYGGRYYSKAIAESITSGGRTFLPFGDEFYASRGHKIVIGDTDSLYISIQNDADPEVLNKQYIDALYEMLRRKYNVFKPEYLQMSYEKRMESVLIIAKKLYSAWVVMEDGKSVDGHLVNKGLMMLKGNFPKWASNICLEILTDLLSRKYENVDHYLRIINREKDKLANGKVDWHGLLISARIGKALSEYQNENALCHVRIARRLAASGKYIPAYSTISYLITDASADPMEGIADDEVNENSEYDATYYWNQILIKQLESLLSPVFKEIDWETIKFPRYLKRTNYFTLKSKVSL